MPTLRRAVRLAPGQLLEGTRYRIVRWLGAGGMALVFEAAHIDIDRRVALKILAEESAHDVKTATVFRREARTVSKLGSPNIVEVYDFGELDDGRLWFAMELVEGQDLATALKGGPFTAERAIPILRQICKGLYAAHSEGIVHRDIKPENILLTTRNRRADTVKIVDFGVSAMLVGGMTIDRSGAGTPAYAAPEQILGEASDARVDVYSLGCTAYELLSGKQPFEGGVETVLRSHVSMQPQAPSAVTPGAIPPPLERIVLRCMSKSPTERYATAAELEAALCEAQIELGLTTPWDDLEIPNVDAATRERLMNEMPRLGRFGTHRWLWPAIAASAIAATGALAGALFMREPTPAQIDRVQQLVNEARTAAARAYFVYPPPDDPDHVTAYRKTMELESLDGAFMDAGDEAAQRLREEFADTLTRLGDYYWERDGGRPFSIDYYAQALIFDGDRPQARERAFMTRGELVDLRERARDSEFEEAELEAAGALVALAETDEQRRKQRLSKLLNNRSRRGTTRDQRLERVARGIGVPVVTEPEARPTVTNPPPVREQPADEQAQGPGRQTDESKTAVRNPRQAQSLVRQARSARKRGNLEDAEALYHRALEHDPRHAGALMDLSDLHFDRGQYPRAVEFAKRGVAASPRKAGYRLRLGDALLKVLRYSDARTEYEMAAKLGHADAADRIARLDRKQGK